MQKLVLENQFGEESINAVIGSVIPLPGAGNIIIMNGATAPINGTTGDNIAGKGSLYIAQDSGALYLQTGAITNPVWSLVEASNNVLSQALTGFVSGAGSVTAADTILTAFNKINGNEVASAAVAAAALPSASFTSAAVTGKALTGFVSGAGTVTSADTVLTAFNKIDGNEIATAAVAAAALPSASFTSAAVTAKVLTGLAAGTNTPIASTDTILAALANLQAQIDALA